MRESGLATSDGDDLCQFSETEEAVRKLKIRDQPIQEDETEAQQAMNSMANQLRLVILPFSGTIHFTNCPPASTNIRNQSFSR
jgi:hypothetical protein